MAKLKLEDYIHLLDRMLERDGLAEVERDAIFNDPTNSELITARFRKRTHPKEVIKQLDRRPVDAMYASLRESLSELGYDTLNEAGWDSSWTEENAIKVGDQDLSLTYYVVYDTPNGIEVIVAVSASEIRKLGYEADTDLKLWSHGDEYYHGEPEDEDDDEWWEENYVNVREIDDSEAYDIVTDDPTAPPMDWKTQYTNEEFEQLLIDDQVIMNKRRKLSEANETPELTQGQQYAVDYLKSQGLEFISTPENIKRGTLMFKIKDKNEYYGLYKTGYIRKGSMGRHGYYGHANPPSLRMGVLHKIRPPQYEERGFIDDDEYMELAHIASQKISRARKIEKNKEERGGRASYINAMYKRLKDTTEETGYGYGGYQTINPEEVKAAIKKLYKKYFPE